jgi:hypothetical protein
MNRNHLAPVGFFALSLALCAALPDPGKATPTKSKNASNPTTHARAASDTPLYPLTQKNGPWMVLVKSFQGPEAIELANQLASELREQRIPAYVATTSMFKQALPQAEQTGAVRGRVRQYEGAVVLAGDFRTEKAGARMLERVREYRPKCINQDMVTPYQWDAGPLRTAFLITNPLAPQADDKPKTNSFLIKLNSGTNSLFKCPGEYTLQVANFSGMVAYTSDAAKKLEEKLKDNDSMLQRAGDRAEQLTQLLIQQGYEAYVFHGETCSMVCVGSFSSTQDQRATQLAQQLAGTKVGQFNLTRSPALIKVPQR